MAAEWDLNSVAPKAVRKVDRMNSMKVVLWVVKKGAMTVDKKDEAKVALMAVWISLYWLTGGSRGRLGRRLATG